MRLRSVSTRRLVFIRFGIRDQVLVQCLGSAGGGSISFILRSCFSLSPDNLGLGPVFTLSAMDFQDAPGRSVVSFLNETSGLNGLQ
jgi:hypothetical protein